MKHGREFCLFLLAGAMASIFALPLRAQENAGQTTSSQAATQFGPGDVNLDASRAFIFVDKTGLGHQHAVEAKLASGRLLLGAQENAGELVFDMTSFDADTTRARRYLRLEGETAESTREQVNANMKGPSILDVERYPQAVFTVDSALATGQSTKSGEPVYALSGKFLLHGVEKPLKIQSVISQARGWLLMRGSFEIKQTSFKITPFTKAFGAIGVADNLKIYGDIWIAPNSLVDLSNVPILK